jgi:hypothetical protein
MNRDALTDSKMIHQFRDNVAKRTEHGWHSSIRHGQRNKGETMRLATRGFTVQTQLAFLMRFEQRRDDRDALVDQAPEIRFEPITTPRSRDDDKGARNVEGNREDVRLPE